MRFSLAVSQDRLLCLLRLLNAPGIALDKADALGETALMQAVESDIALNVINMVRAPGVNVNRRDRRGAVTR
ncbi:hypothetical protein [Candidatus Sodalis pierantonius]|uniref:hypothetical protein n=1 Tax=Candidatus Sodalis pierantonii TaxID=1486991 RepID=UPI00046D2F25|nr:hypothetical protein [Candidatus Sodalis pierantonius]